MTTFNPKVSIIIPVYNGSNYMREAIDSALAQTYKNIEVIVVNDGSNDEGTTHDIALSYGAKIKYYKKENGGVSTALNLGIEKMTGEYFSWLSHDDVYALDKIESQINFLRKQDNRNIILYSDFEYIDDKSRPVMKFRVRNKKKNTIYAVLKGLIHGCTLLIPKNCFAQLGKFNAELKTTQDYDLWFKFVRVYPIIHLPYVLVYSRDHEAQGSKTIQGHIKEGNKLYMKFADLLTEAEILKLEKNVDQFYLKVALFLKQISYHQAAFYWLSKVKKFTFFRLLIFKGYPSFCLRSFSVLKILIVHPNVFFFFFIKKIKELKKK